MGWDFKRKSDAEKLLRIARSGDTETSASNQENGSSYDSGKISRWRDSRANFYRCD